MQTTIRATDERTLRLLDGLVVFWVVLWVVLGTWSGVTIWRVADAGDTISSSGRALASVGGGLQSLADIPVIGEKPRAVGEQVSTTAADVTARGQDLKGELRRLGVLLGLAIVAIPSAPVAGLYLPLRLARRREVAGIRAALARQPHDQGLDRYLADRARSTLSFDVVAGLGSAAEDDAGRTRALADAELSRLGLARPAQV
ncbi:MAG: hypothetical protein WB441_11805 [Nocardioidaceae bacterium]